MCVPCPTFLPASVVGAIMPFTIAKPKNNNNNNNKTNKQTNKLKQYNENFKTLKMLKSYWKRKDLPGA